MVAPVLGILTVKRLYGTGAENFPGIIEAVILTGVDDPVSKGSGRDRPLRQDKAKGQAD